MPEQVFLSLQSNRFPESSFCVPLCCEVEGMWLCAKLRPKGGCCLENYVLFGVQKAF